jgi:hypothetical protein
MQVDRIKSSKSIVFAASECQNDNKKTHAFNFLNSTLLKLKRISKDVGQQQTYAPLNTR